MHGSIGPNPNRAATTATSFIIRIINNTNASDPTNTATAATITGNTAGANVFRGGRRPLTIGSGTHF